MQALSAARRGAAPAERQSRIFVLQANYVVPKTLDILVRADQREKISRSPELTGLIWTKSEQKGRETPHPQFDTKNSCLCSHRQSVRCIQRDTAEAPLTDGRLSANRVPSSALNPRRFSPRLENNFFRLQGIAQTQ